MTPSITSLKNLDLSLLAQRLGKLCQQLDIEVTTAESCTGGGIASAITSAAGSSAYFTTGYVTYANAAKTRLIGVSDVTLHTHGAVSEAVVNAMVAGACRDSGAQLGVAVSGVAGPGGGSDEKPVGTVWLAWGDVNHQEAKCFHFPGDRQAVREQAVREALAGLVARLDMLAEGQEEK
ncbi:C-terminal domain of CinA type S; Protein Implicated in DNA repair function with RecA and MutS [Halomonas citrativorans]|uniref:C-terminal domain of CinA type S Protein Implicated in DNA repair function with RecA and MutS n=1 Tax=Halomonas citrativorans TaxID=2742612 RepID=A0A1R4HY13_9GAMM|nr:CinA family protein [Halomonas citrativorans]MBE0402409.1 CinA family protein [Halomonas citrativorans]SJN12467.1 C-terminal domain of CinA type S; Protein Implicated in DNA repair function with RecA and MutS [Halomonas citrativorans]